MSTKTISITEEAYKRLASKKKEKESFSSVINRLTSKDSLLNFAGIFSKSGAAKLEKNIKANRTSSRKRTSEIRF